MKRKPSIALVSLGCPKNLVDLQVVGAHLFDAGFDVGVPEGEADAIIVNTCAFIADARAEAEASIEEACACKANPDLPCRAVIVTGCVPQRYGAALLDAIPEIDAIAGVDDLARIPQIVARALAGERVQGVSAAVSKALFESPHPEFSLTGAPHAYIKIGEGCRHACAFCAIPGIRGKLRSRTRRSILAEARALLRAGKRELDLVAQDVTSYGVDLMPRSSISALLRDLDGIKGDFKIRFLYGHPAMVADELLETVAKSKHVIPYFDIPVQHSDPAVLSAMRRADTVKEVPRMAARIRAAVPGAVLRTTCLVGFPEETDASFENLLAFVKETKFDHLGAFVYSPEDGTPGAEMPNRPPLKTAVKRRNALMRLQRGIVAAKLDALVGAETTVLLENPPHGGKGQWTGRALRQAPDGIDGVSFVSGVPRGAGAGDFVKVRVTGHSDYDLETEFIA